MADEMLRIAGRGDDGLAKAIKTDDTGTLKVSSQLTGSIVTDELFTNQREVINVLNDDYIVMGAYWNKGSVSALTRTGGADGKVANAGVGGGLVVNDFDSMPIYRDIHEVTDDLGNVFIRIPKCYVKKKDGEGFHTRQISKMKHGDFYLPWCFWDFENNKELDHIDVGKHKASLSVGNKLESKPDKHPLVSRHIVDFRTLAKNNNVDGLKGYQQLDSHVVDLLQTLFYIEFATLDSQAIMQGFSTGQYSATHTATVAELATNRIIVTNAVALNYRVGQSIGIGSANSNDSVSITPRIITDIDDTYDIDNTSVVFDGDPIDIAIGNVATNRGWINGFSDDILASSGSIGSNSDGKYPCSYRGIESPWGDIWQFVDGINISDYQTWVANNAEDYASNVFASPYEQIGYTNATVNGYVDQMGFDKNYPSAQFPISTSGGSTTYYADYYYQTTGARIALFGGYWSDGAADGVSCWNLYSSSSYAAVNIGGRLLKKAL